MLPPIASVLETSLRASVFIVCLIVLRSLLRPWLGSRAVAGLWLVAAGSLLLPASVSVPWHVPPLLAARVQTLARPFAFRVSVSPAAPAVRPTPNSPASSLPPFPTTPDRNLWTLLWLAGTLLAAGRLARGWWTTRRWAARASPGGADPRLQQIFLALPAPLRRNVALRLTDDLDVPTLAGVIRPQIWFPRPLLDTLETPEIRHVLLHELGHARRRDLLAQWLCSLVCCVHWFNPLVWLLARLARTDRELACDAWVLARVLPTSDSADNPSAYGHTLLKIVERLRTPALRHGPALVSMAAGRRSLGLRVREIGTFRPVPPWRGGVALAGTLVSIVVLTVRGAPAVSPSPISAAVASPVPLLPPASSAPSAVGASPVPNASPKLAADLSSVPPQVMVNSKLITLSKSAMQALEKDEKQSDPFSTFAHQAVTFYDAQARASTGVPVGVFNSSFILTETLDSVLRQLNQLPGVDLVSSPLFITKSGQKATIAIIREFKYPVAYNHGHDAAGKTTLTASRFDQINVGLALEVNPTVTSGSIALDLSLNLTSFVGFKRDDGKPFTPGQPDDGHRQPVFTIRKLQTSSSLFSGATLVLKIPGRNPGLWQAMNLKDLGDGTRPISPRPDEEMALVLITAKLIDQPSAVPAPTSGSGARSAAPGTSYQEEVVTSSPSPAPSSAAGTTPDQSVTSVRLPYGVPVPGKRGFVTSPYAPDAGYVDLHGYTRGQFVRDPYTGKMFLVP